jgi:flavodoxin
MATVLNNAELVNLNKVDTPALADYDLIGFGSGIYWGHHDKRLLDLVGTLPLVNNKKAFIFSTSGIRENRVLNDFNRRLKRKLLEKEFITIGDFSCRGFDTVGPLILIGRIHKGRSNENDLEGAADFAKGLQAK